MVKRQKLENQLVELQNELTQYKDWCGTRQGFMMISECPECGTRYRFHGITTDRNDYYKFLENFSLKLYIQEKK